MRDTRTCVALASLVLFGVALERPSFAWAQVDLRLDERSERHGPRREDALVEGETEDETRDPESDPLEAETEPEDEAVPAYAPPRSASGGATPGLASARAPEPETVDRARNLYFQLIVGAHLGVTLGGRVGQRLSLGVGAHRTLIAPRWMPSTNHRELDYANAERQSFYGAFADWYPRRGYFQLRAGLGASRIFRTEWRPDPEDLTVLVPDYGIRSVAPAMDLGLGAHWRPTGSYRRFRLGFFLEATASTFEDRGNRFGLFDLSFSTAVTWF